MIHISPKISLIAAIGKNRELGKGNDLVFKIRQDMKYFKEKTMGHVVIMGRKTYESIGRPLPNRTNIVITRNSQFMNQDSSLHVAHSIEEAMEIGREEESRLRQGSAEPGEIFVIGGAEIYKLAFPYANKLYLTIVNAQDLDADAYFPEYSGFGKIVSEIKGKEEDYTYAFVEIEH